MREFVDGGLLEYEFAFVALDDGAALEHLGHQALRHLAQLFGLKVLKVLIDHRV